MTIWVGALVWVLSNTIGLLRARPAKPGSAFRGYVIGRNTGREGDGAALLRH